MSIKKQRLKVLLYGNFFGAYRSQNLVKYLLDEGYRTTIISPEFYYERGEKKTLIAKLFRILFSGYYFIELFIKASLADVIYLLPLNSNLIQPVILASRIFRTKLIVEMYISSYDTTIREKQEFPIDSPTAQRIRKNDILALSEADYIIHLSRHELRYWESILDIQIDDSKVWVAPLFCETTLKQMCQSSLEQEQCLRICWWGTMLPSHGIDTILEALQRLKDAGHSFTCQLFGAPAKGKEDLIQVYKAEIQKRNLSDVVFLRQDLTFRDGSLPSYLVQNCDLALGMFGSTEKAHAAVPNKIVEALTLGIPVLNMSTPALSEFFDPGKDLWTCPATPEGIADALGKIAAGSAYPVDWPQTRELVLKTFSLETYQTTVNTVLSHAAKSFTSRTSNIALKEHEMLSSGEAPSS